MPVTKENFLDVWVLLYYLQNEHNQTKWQFQVVEPHVITDVAVPLLKEWNKAYTKKVVLHDSNFSLRLLFDSFISLVPPLTKYLEKITTPTSTQPTALPQYPSSP